MQYPSSIPDCNPMLRPWLKVAYCPLLAMSSQAKAKSWFTKLWISVHVVHKHKPTGSWGPCLWAPPAHHLHRDMERTSGSIVEPGTTSVFSPVAARSNRMPLTRLLNDQNSISSGVICMGRTWYLLTTCTLFHLNFGKRNCPLLPLPIPMKIQF